MCILNHKAIISSYYTTESLHFRFSVSCTSSLHRILGLEFLGRVTLSASLQLGSLSRDFLLDKFSIWFHSDLFNLTEFLRNIPTTDWGVEVVKAELRFRLPDRGRTSPGCVWFLYFEPLCHKFNLSSVFYCFRIFFDFWWCVKLCYHYRGLLTLIWILRCSELPSYVSSKLTLKCWRIHKGKERSFN